MKILSQDFSFSNFFTPDVGAAFNGDYSEDTDVSLGAPSKGSSNADEGNQDTASRDYSSPPGRQTLIINVYC